jgi:hypothetical protein
MKKLENQISLEASKKNAFSIIEKAKIKIVKRSKLIYLNRQFDWKNNESTLKSALIHLKYSHEFFFKYV